MSAPIADLVELLLSTGIPPDKIARAVELAQLHAQQSAEFHRNSTGSPVDTAAEKRREYDRRRKSAKRNSTGKSADIEVAAISLTSSPSESQKGLAEEKKNSDGVSGRAKAGRTLPDDWQPNAGHHAVAEQLGISPEQMLGMADDMRLWAGANRNRAIARKADWDMTFIGWMRRNSRSRAGPAMNGHAPRPGSREDRQERTTNALSKLRQYVDTHADEPSGGGGPGGPIAGLLPFRKSG